MLMLDIRDYDKLYELVMRLSAITYLQYAVTDEEFVAYNTNGFEFGLTYTRNMLYEEQRKTVLELKELISSDDFMKTSSRCPCDAYLVNNE